MTYLEGRCNGASNLIGELNLLADLYAKDLMMIRTGKAGENDANLTFMKEGKAFERSLVLMDKAKTFQALAQALKPEPVKAEKEPAETKAEPEPAPKRKNIQDFALNKS